MEQQTKNKTMNNSNQPNETTENRQQTKPCKTAINLVTQCTTNQTMYDRNQPNETTETNQTMYNSNQSNRTTDNKSNHVQQQSV